MKIIIVGGVAAGASAAARLRRLDERADIILMEKGEAISYANCGLPYRIGNVIAERGNLLVMKPEKFASWFNIEVRTRHEVTDIDTASRTVTASGPNGQYSESYDKLLLATPKRGLGTLIFNLRLNVEMLKTPEKRAIVKSLITNFFKRGGMQIQVTITNQETLRINDAPNLLCSNSVRIMAWTCPSASE